MLENIRGHSRGSIPPLRMPSPLPHDLCHEWNVSRRLPAPPHLYPRRVSSLLNGTAKPNHVHLSESSLPLVINISPDYMSQRKPNGMKMMKPERFGPETHTMHTSWDYSTIKSVLKRGQTEQRPVFVV